MAQLQFSLQEVLSLIGVIQCVYVLVYVSFRAKRLVRVLLPVMYFFVLGSAFFVDLARSYISDLTPYYEIISWLSWGMVIPLGVLLIIQMARIDRLPEIWDWGVLLLVPCAYGVSYLYITAFDQACPTEFFTCSLWHEALTVSASIAGAISLLVIWGHRTLFRTVLAQNAGQERYWLILSLILVNIGFIAIYLMQAAGYDSQVNIALIRTIFGLAFIYIVSTSLFRIYPVSVFFASAPKKEEEGLTAEEQEIARKIEGLLHRERVYHETTYSRSDMARELGVSEGMLSRIIKLHFQKSLPQLLNEHRIEDAKRLLLETQASIKVIAQEVGFNSLASFNRVFKESVGQTPSQYRKNTIK